MSRRRPLLPPNAASSSASASNASMPVYATIPAHSKNIQEGPDPTRKKVLLMGLRMSGKTSVMQVPFSNLPAKDTFYLESTTRIAKLDYDDPVLSLQFWDCPGSLHIENLNIPLTHFSTVVFVIDIQDDYHHPIAQLVHLMAYAWEGHRRLNLEVFVHKSEGSSEDYKTENFRQIQQRLYDELIDHALPLEQLPITFYLTSVYDNTVYDAWSRVITKLNVQQFNLENLIDSFCVNSGIAKAFLFDVNSLIYVATDVSPVDQASFGLCCEFVKTLASFSELYKNVRPEHSFLHQHPQQSTISLQSQQEKSESPSPILASSSNSFSSLPIAPLPLPRSATNPIPIPPTINFLSPALLPSDGDPASFKNNADEDKRWGSGSVRLLPETTLAYWQITNELSLVILIRSDTYEAHRGLIEFNVTLFRRGVHGIGRIEIARKERARGG